MTINQAGQPLGDPTTLRHLTLNGNAGTVSLPPGNYGRMTLNNTNALVLGVAGSPQPAAYSFQALTLNGSSQISVVGPVQITLATGGAWNGTLGNPVYPAWLTLRVGGGSVTLNEALRDLTTRGIAYQVPWTEYLQVSRFPVLSADTQFDAQTEGIFRAFTDDLIRSSGQARGNRTWRPERWVCNDQAVIYTRPLVYLFDLGPAGAFNFQKWRVPQPTLLLSMPGGGCPAYAP